MTKIGDLGLRMSDGEVKMFKTKAKRDNFEKVAQAYKHGWNPKTGKKGKRMGAFQEAVDKMG